MIQYLQSYCDINEIDQVDSLMSIGSVLTKKNKSLVSFSRFSYLLHGFRRLVDEQIDLEQFMMLGDIVSDEILEFPNIFVDALAKISFEMSVDETAYTHSIVVIDSVALTQVDQTDVSEIEKELEKRKSSLIIVK